jgi:hypothetical protein
MQPPTFAGTGQDQYRWKLRVVVGTGQRYDVDAAEPELLRP